MGMGEGLDECLCLHAEENALLEAGRERVSGGGLEGAVLYCNTYVPPSYLSSRIVLTLALSLSKLSLPVSSLSFHPINPVPDLSLHHRRCTVKIVQCGVREVVYSLSYSMDASSRRVMEEAGVGLRQIVMPAFPRG